MKFFQIKKSKSFLKDQPNLSKIENINSILPYGMINNPISETSGILKKSKSHSFIIKTNPVKSKTQVGDKLSKNQRNLTEIPTDQKSKINDVSFIQKCFFSRKSEKKQKIDCKDMMNYETFANNDILHSKIANSNLHRQNPFEKSNHSLKSNQKRMEREFNSRKNTLLAEFSPPIHLLTKKFQTTKLYSQTSNSIEKKKNKDEKLEDNENDSQNHSKINHPNNQRNVNEMIKNDKKRMVLKTESQNKKENYNKILMKNHRSDSSFSCSAISSSNEIRKTKNELFRLKKANSNKKIHFDDKSNKIDLKNAFKQSQSKMIDASPMFIENQFGELLETYEGIFEELRNLKNQSEEFWKVRMEILAEQNGKFVKNQKKIFQNYLRIFGNNRVEFCTPWVFNNIEILDKTLQGLRKCQLELRVKSNVRRISELFNFSFEFIQQLVFKVSRPFNQDALKFRMSSDFSKKSTPLYQTIVWIRLIKMTVSVEKVFCCLIDFFWKKLNNFQSKIENSNKEQLESLKEELKKFIPFLNLKHQHLMSEKSDHIFFGWNSRVKLDEHFKNRIDYKLLNLRVSWIFYQILVKLNCESKALTIVLKSLEANMKFVGIYLDFYIKYRYIHKYLNLDKSSCIDDTNAQKDAKERDYFESENSRFDKYNQSFLDMANEIVDAKTRLFYADHVIEYLERVLSIREIRRLFTVVSKHCIESHKAKEAKSLIIHLVYMFENIDLFELSSSDKTDKRKTNNTVDSEKETPDEMISSDDNGNKIRDQPQKTDSRSNHLYWINRVELFHDVVGDFIKIPPLKALFLSTAEISLRFLKDYNLFTLNAYRLFLNDLLLEVTSQLSEYSIALTYLSNSYFIYRNTLLRIEMTDPSRFPRPNQHKPDPFSESFYTSVYSILQEFHISMLGVHRKILSGMQQRKITNVPLYVSVRDCIDNLRKQECFNHRDFVAFSEANKLKMDLLSSLKPTLCVSFPFYHGRFVKTDFERWLRLRLSSDLQKRRWENRVDWQSSTECFSMKSKQMIDKNTLKVFLDIGSDESRMIELLFRINWRILNEVHMNGGSDDNCKTNSENKINKIHEKNNLGSLKPDREFGNFRSIDKKVMTNEFANLNCHNFTKEQNLADNRQMVGLSGKNRFHSIYSDVSSMQREYSLLQNKKGTFDKKNSGFNRKGSLFDPFNQLSKSNFSSNYIRNQVQKAIANDNLSSPQHFKDISPFDSIGKNQLSMLKNHFDQKLKDALEGRDFSKKKSRFCKVSSTGLLGRTFVKNLSQFTGSRNEQIKDFENKEPRTPKREVCSKIRDCPPDCPLERKISFEIRNFSKKSLSVLRKYLNKFFKRIHLKLTGCFIKTDKLKEIKRKNADTKTFVKFLLDKPKMYSIQQIQKGLLNKLGKISEKSNFLNSFGRSVNSLSDNYGLCLNKPEKFERNEVILTTMTQEGNDEKQKCLPKQPDCFKSENFHQLSRFGPSKKDSQKKIDQNEFSFRRENIDKSSMNHHQNRISFISNSTRTRSNSLQVEKRSIKNSLTRISQFIDYASQMELKRTHSFLNYLKKKRGSIKVAIISKQRQFKIEIHNYLKEKAQQKFFEELFEQEEDDYVDPLNSCKILKTKYFKFFNTRLLKTEKIELNFEISQTCLTFHLSFDRQKYFLKNNTLTLHFYCEQTLQKVYYEMLKECQTNFCTIIPVLHNFLTLKYFKSTLSLKEDFYIEESMSAKRMKETLKATGIQLPLVYHPNVRYYTEYLDEIKLGLFTPYDLKSLNAFFHFFRYFLIHFEKAQVRKVNGPVPQKTLNFDDFISSEANRLKNVPSFQESKNCLKSQKNTSSTPSLQFSPSNLFTNQLNSILIERLVHSCGMNSHRIILESMKIPLKRRPAIKSELDTDVKCQTILTLTVSHFRQSIYSNLKMNNSLNFHIFSHLMKFDGCLVKVNFEMHVDFEALNFISQNIDEQFNEYSFDNCTVFMMMIVERILKIRVWTEDRFANPDEINHEEVQNFQVYQESYFLGMLDAISYVLVDDWMTAKNWKSSKEIKEFLDFSRGINSTHDEFWNHLNNFKEEFETDETENEQREYFDQDSGVHQNFDENNQRKKNKIEREVKDKKRENSLDRLLQETNQILIRSNVKDEPKIEKKREYEKEKKISEVNEKFKPTNSKKNELNLRINPFEKSNWNLKIIFAHVKKNLNALQKIILAILGTPFDYKKNALFFTRLAVKLSNQNIIKKGVGLLKKENKIYRKLNVDLNEFLWKENKSLKILQKFIEKFFLFKKNGSFSNKKYLEFLVKFGLKKHENKDEVKKKEIERNEKLKKTESIIKANENKDSRIASKNQLDVIFRKLSTSNNKKILIDLIKAKSDQKISPKETSNEEKIEIKIKKIHDSSQDNTNFRVDSFSNGVVEEKRIRNSNEKVSDDFNRIVNRNSFERSSNSFHDSKNRKSDDDLSNRAPENKNSLVPQTSIDAQKHNFFSQMTSIRPNENSLKQQPDELETQNHPSKTAISQMQSVDSFTKQLTQYMNEKKKFDQNDDYMNRTSIFQIDKCGRMTSKNVNIRTFPRKEKNSHFSLVYDKTISQKRTLVQGSHKFYNHSVIGYEINRRNNILNFEFDVYDNNFCLLIFRTNFRLKIEGNIDHQKKIVSFVNSHQTTYSDSHDCERKQMVENTYEKSEPNNSLDQNSESKEKLIDDNSSDGDASENSQMLRSKNSSQPICKNEENSKFLSDDQILMEKERGIINGPEEIKKEKIDGKIQNSIGLNNQLNDEKTSFLRNQFGDVNINRFGINEKKPVNCQANFQQHECLAFENFYNLKYSIYDSLKFQTFKGILKKEDLVRLIFIINAESQQALPNYRIELIVENFETILFKDRHEISSQNSIGLNPLAMRVKNNQKITTQLCKPLEECTRQEIISKKCMKNSIILSENDFVEETIRILLSNSSENLQEMFHGNSDFETSKLLKIRTIENIGKCLCEIRITIWKPIIWKKKILNLKDNLKEQYGIDIPSKERSFLFVEKIFADLLLEILKNPFDFCLNEEKNELYFTKNDFKFLFQIWVCPNESKFRKYAYWINEKDFFSIMNSFMKKIIQKKSIAEVIKKFTEMCPIDFFNNLIDFILNNLILKHHFFFNKLFLKIPVLQIEIEMETKNKINLKERKFICQIIETKGPENKKDIENRRFEFLNKKNDFESNFFINRKIKHLPFKQNHFFILTCKYHNTGLIKKTLSEEIMEDTLMIWKRVILMSNSYSIVTLKYHTRFRQFSMTIYNPSSKRIAHSEIRKKNIKNCIQTIGNLFLFRLLNNLVFSNDSKCQQLQSSSLILQSLMKLWIESEISFVLEIKKEMFDEKRTDSTNELRKKNQTFSDKKFDSVNEISGIKCFNDRSIDSQKEKLESLIVSLKHPIQENLNLIENKIKNALKISGISKMLKSVFSKNFNEFLDLKKVQKKQKQKSDFQTQITLNRPKRITQTEINKVLTGLQKDDFLKSDFCSKTNINQDFIKLNRESVLKMIGHSFLSNNQNLISEYRELVCEYEFYQKSKKIKILVFLENLNQLEKEEIATKEKNDVRQIKKSKNTDSNKSDEFESSKVFFSKRFPVFSFKNCDLLDLVVEVVKFEKIKDSHKFKSVTFEKTKINVKKAIGIFLTENNDFSRRSLANDNLSIKMMKDLGRFVAQKSIGISGCYGGWQTEEKNVWKTKKY